MSINLFTVLNILIAFFVFFIEAVNEILNVSSPKTNIYAAEFNFFFDDELEDVSCDIIIYLDVRISWNESCETN